MDHLLYKTGDAGVFGHITDSNGEVVLAYCKACGQGEADLEDDCPAFGVQPWAKAQHDYGDMYPDRNHANDEVAALRAIIARDHKDAARYRAWRDSALAQNQEVLNRLHEMRPDGNYTHDAWDAAWDTIIKEKIV